MSGGMNLFLKLILNKIFRVSMFCLYAVLLVFVLGTAVYVDGLIATVVGLVMSVFISAVMSHMIYGFWNAVDVGGVNG